MGEFNLSNINHFTLSDITNKEYVFEGIIPGDPYRVVADVYDSQNFQHILSNVVLGSTNQHGYFWPTDDIEFDDSNIEYEIKYDSIFSTEIPLFITVNNLDALNTAGTKIQFDIYTEPIKDDYAQHPNKKFQTGDIVENLTRFFMSDLGVLVPYNIFYSLKVKFADSDDYKFYKSHVLVASNVRTTDPGVHVDIVPIEPSSVETLRLRRVVSEHYQGRRLKIHVKKYLVSDTHSLIL
jgi:hypothetical protein